MSTAQAVREYLLQAEERCVPPEHPDSSYRLARESLLDKIMLLPDNIHRIQGELPPAEAAAAYRSELETVAVRDNRVWFGIE